MILTKEQIQELVECQRVFENESFSIDRILGQKEISEEQFNAYIKARNIIQSKEW